VGGGLKNDATIVGMELEDVEDTALFNPTEFCITRLPKKQLTFLFYFYYVLFLGRRKLYNHKKYMRKNRLAVQKENV